MRIALLDADPRICGPMSWTRHMKSGLSELGHTVDVVSSTKSGKSRSSWGTAKWGGRWSAWAPDRVVRDRDLTSVLNEYEFVILPEPKVPAIDKLALKEASTPAYVVALTKTKTPWTTALHGNDYYTKDAPFLVDLLQADSFTGRLISHSKRSTERSDLPDHLAVLHLPLPYRPLMPIDSEIYDNGRVIGMTGRFMMNKGYHVVAMSGRHLDPGHSIELWGSATTGLGTNVTFAVYEALLPYSSNYVRHGDQEEKKDNPAVTEHGNTIRPYHWDILLENGVSVRYLGNYVNPVATSLRLGVHVNLTSYKYSGGLVEYSTLEAIDAGCMCITTTNTSGYDFRTRQVEVTNLPGTMKTLNANYDIVTELASAIEETSNVASNKTWRNEIAMHNRIELRNVSDPAKIAQQFLN